MQGTAEVLHEDGFIVLRGVLSDVEVEKGSSCISASGDEVNYSEVREFIRQSMFKRVQEQLGIPESLDYVKYRVSDNNNSADAAGFHRDLIFAGGGTSTVFCPCFTCLTYFDKTTMELIPGSHVKNYELYETWHLYSKRVRLTIYPGDILFFFSTLLHRGVFTEGIRHRRLIQVFEVFTDPNIRDTFTPMIVHVPGDEKYSDWMVRASKGTGPFISLINTYGFLNAATGYGWRSHPLTKCGLRRDHLFFSSEGLRGRIKVEPNTWQPINKYVINDSITVHNVSPACFSTYKYYAFNRQFYYYTLLLLTYTVIVATTIYISARRIMYTRKQK